MSNLLTLKDISILITKGTTPTSIGRNFVSTGINFVKSESIKDSKHLDSSLFMKIDSETDDKLKRSRLEKDDLLFSIAGAYLGKLAIVQDIDLPANTNQAVGIIRLNKRKANVDYIYYFFSQPSVNKYINSLSAQSSQPNINLELLGRLSFKYIDLKEQIKIANILSVIDKKIELNKRINTELEAMAKTLYDYWFVQFDFPNKDGKPYKSTGGKMVYNAILKREIPEGWKNIQLGNVVARIGTGLNPRDNFKLGEGKNYYITIKDIEQNKILFSDKADRISDEALDIINQRSDLKEGDILFTSIQPVGLTYLIHNKPINWNINESVFTIRANSSLVTSEYLFKLLSSEQMKVFTKNSSSGSVHKGIRHGILKTFVFAYPSLPRIEKFTAVIKPILQKQYNLEIENQQLATLRDWLLPMLMNGQVTVK
ncbi:restriction endonuclease subunit S [Entomomonas sp. E2T0]|uniref:restriction endonuclease subunit S n=1 Tax=Entomomonas sp. E2T0 TaxID=2930213 RepID=UPI0022282609|nr:restriction endonuclease subunit S [Entomomonas sp. E2T0]UYZ84340.1 restriction endonuclease subunit S [Entomomonas sp. E2T0]